LYSQKVKWFFKVIFKLISKIRFNLASSLCKFLPPLISQRLRHYLYPRYLALDNPIFYEKRSVTGSTLKSDTAEYHGYSFGIHGYYEWRLLVVALVMKDEKGDMIEVGANIGTETVSFCDLYKLNNKEVYSFEPLNDHYQKLLELKKNNNLKNLNVVCKALGKREQVLKFVIPKDKFTSGAGHISGNTFKSTDRLINVQCDTLDNYQNEILNVNLICMDAEGSEVDILKGGKSLLERDKPVLILEVSRKLLERYGYSNEDILSELQSLGYTFYKISRFGIKDYEIKDQKKKANVICIHKMKNNLVKVIDRKLKISGFTPMIKGINPLKF